MPHICCRPTRLRLDRGEQSGAMFDLPGLVIHCDHQTNVNGGWILPNEKEGLKVYRTIFPRSGRASVNAFVASEGEATGYERRDLSKEFSISATTHFHEAAELLRR